MALKSFQKELNLDTLYEVSKQGGSNIGDQVRPNIYIDSGAVDVYGSNSKTQPASLSEMFLNSENSSVTGMASFGFIPTYICIKQNTGTTSEIISSGLDVEDLGGI